MPSNRWKESNKAHIEIRRTWVARFLAIGMKRWEIVNQLGDIPLLNPATGLPYDPSTISRDIGVITRRWQEDAVEHIATLKAAQLAELRAARRQAWTNKSMSEVRRNLEFEARLMGTEAPIKHDVSSLNVNAQLSPEDFGSLSDKELRDFRYYVDEVLGIGGNGNR